MSPWLWGLLPVSAWALIMGVVIGVDRLRAPHRSMLRPIAVVDRRSYRDACGQIDRLIAAELWPQAWAGSIAVCNWLAFERDTGRAARQAWYVAELARWTALRGEWNPLALHGEG